MDYEYKASDKLSHVIQDDYRLLQVMGRFGISMGFGERTIGDVCCQCSVDANAFLGVINYIKSSSVTALYRLDTKESIRSLLCYLKNTHDFFNNYQFPAIRRSLINSIEMQNEIAFLVIKYYDQYVEEVRMHMENEDVTTFAWVEKLLNDNLSELDTEHLLSKHHDSIEKKLSDLKKLFLQYYPQKGNNNELNSVILELYRTEEELRNHCLIEDNLFTPTIKKFQHKMRSSKQVEVRHQVPVNTSNEELLSEREKDIVVCVAKGLSNKEIADVLCLSINTVTTHRRNIARKLSIHSPAGITIYAIVNKLVNIEDIAM